MYEVIGERQLLDVGQSSYEYHSKISSFQQLDLSAVPYELQTLLASMLSVAPAARPSAISITGSQYFQVSSAYVAVAPLPACISNSSCKAIGYIHRRLSVLPQYCRTSRVHDVACTCLLVARQASAVYKGLNAII